MTTDKKAIAIGTFLIACSKLDEVRGGKQKLQKIVGKDIFFQNPVNKKWYYETMVLRDMSIKKINDLIEKIKISK